MIALYITSFLVFTLYIVIILKIFGVLPSISDSYYALKKHNISIPFTLFCWGTAFPLMIYWIELLSNDWNFLPFIACGGLLFVGASPAFKDLELERKVHSISAIICAIAAYTWTFLYGSIFLGINFILLSIILYFILKRNKIYWLELIAFINIYTQLLIISLW
jgi:hypothetical protein